MIAVIFEVWPASGRKDDYLNLAASLRGELDGADGFISIERFQSLTDPDKLLSLSVWRDLAQQYPASRQPGRGPRRHFCRLSPAHRGCHSRLWHERPRAGACGLADRTRRAGRAVTMRTGRDPRDTVTSICRARRGARCSASMSGTSRMAPTARKRITRF